MKSNLKIYNGQDLGVDLSRVSKHAIEVVRVLRDAGYEAYIVGGGIRDLLLGLKPKDFDITTDARPEDVVSMFRRARLIGRRFRIVHVYSGRELIEVSTFRSHHPAAEEPAAETVTHDNHKTKHARSATGQLIRDNVYGSIDDDAIRRDFTVNALYFDPLKNQVLDYTGSIKDIERRRLHIIGDPEDRYREDPVRMLRAVRFAAKLDFSIEKKSAAAIHKLGALLLHIPPARLFDEVLKLLISGQGLTTFRLLLEYDLFRYLFPLTASCLDPSGRTFIEQALTNTDKRIAQGKPVTPAFLFATLLWPPFQNGLQPSDKTTLGDAHQIAQEVIRAQQDATSIPRRFAIPMKEIWEFQFRLPKRRGKNALRLLEHPRFRAAYDFLLLREASGEDLGGLGHWWTEFQNADDQQKLVMSSAAPAGKGPRRRRRSKHRHRADQ